MNLHKEKHSVDFEKISLLVSLILKIFELRKDDMFFIKHQVKCVILPVIISENHLKIGR